MAERFGCTIMCIVNLRHVLAMIVGHLVDRAAIGAQCYAFQPVYMRGILGPGKAGLSPRVLELATYSR
jgi:hypothetical protein